MAKIKKPQPTQGKRVGVSEQQIGQDSNIDYPIFCLRHLHNDYHLSACTKDEKAAFIDTLHRLSTLSWNDIKLLPRHGMGSEHIALNSIKAGIPSFISSDVNNFLAFRFFGKAPFVGHKNGTVFHVIYIDRGFSLYRH